jgi:hypothetical protein
MTLPGESPQVAKIHVEHPIKHSVKSLRNLPSSEQTLKPRLQEEEELELLRKKLRKNSLEALPQNMKYAQATRKLREMEEQVIQKCSLKHLEVYERGQPKEREKVEVSVVRRVVVEKKHILDRILTRLE